MKSLKILIGLSIVSMVLFMFSCNKENVTDDISPDSKLTPYEIVTPFYFPQLIIPSDNPLTVEGIALGRKLYYDPILSNNGKSCSSCHHQSYAFTEPVMNALAHINLAWNNKFLWNGAREGTLENIMLFEVDEFFKTDVSKLNRNSLYVSLFNKVFKTSVITSNEVAKALAQFVRTETSTNSRFDKYLRNELMLSPSEMRGLILYNSEKGDCFHCHSLGLFNDNDFHNIGLDTVFTGVHLGRYNVTNNPADIGKFKTPTLRNIELTAPYMHDGRMATLEEVIEHYNTGIKRTATLDPIFSKENQLNGLQLSALDKADLLAFLQSLTDSSFINNPALSHP